MELDSITDSLKKYKKMECAVWAYPNEYGDKAEDLIPFVNKKWLQYLISSVSTYKMFYYPAYKDLFLKTMPLEITFNTNFDLLGLYLCAKGIVDQNSLASPDAIHRHNTYTVEYFEEPIKQNSVESFIKSDNIKEFVNYIKNHNINICKERVLIFGFSFYYSSLAAYCGSLKIMQYLLLNDADLDFRTIERAINGGHQSIIDFLVHRDVSFNFQLRSAVIYHQNTVAKWLMDNYECESIQLPNFLIWNNLEMFLYFLIEKNANINEAKSYSNVTSLMVAAQFSNIPLINFLIMRGADKSKIDRNRKLAIDYSSVEEVKKLLQL